MAGQGFGDWWKNVTGDVGNAVSKHPWETAALAATAVAAPFLLPEIGAAIGVGEGVAGATAGEGIFGGVFGGTAAAEGGALAGAEGAEALAGGIGSDALLAGGADTLLPAGATPTAFEGLAGGVGGEAAPMGIGDAIGSSATAGSGPFDVGGATGSATGGEPGIWDKIVSGATKSVTSNPLGIAAAGGGLAMNMMRGNPDSPEAKKLREQAAQLGSQGQALQQYLANGTLPPAMQAQLDNATKAAKARIISNHARNGMPTDPSQNSALAQELNAADMNAVAAMGQAQIDMMKTGLSETGLSSQLYEMLVKMDRQNNTDLMNSISSFAAALGGGSKTVQLKMA